MTAGPVPGRAPAGRDRNQPAGVARYSGTRAEAALLSASPWSWGWHFVLTGLSTAPAPPSAQTGVAIAFLVLTVLMHLCAPRRPVGRSGAPADGGGSTDRPGHIRRLT